MIQRLLSNKIDYILQLQESFLTNKGQKNYLYAQFLWILLEKCIDSKITKENVALLLQDIEKTRNQFNNQGTFYYQNIGLQVKNLKILKQIHQNVEYNQECFQKIIEHVILNLQLIFSNIQLGRKIEHYSFLKYDQSLNSVSQQIDWVTEVHEISSSKFTNPHIRDRQIIIEIANFCNQKAFELGIVQIIDRNLLQIAIKENIQLNEFLFDVVYQVKQMLDNQIILNQFWDEGIIEHLVELIFNQKQYELSYFIVVFEFFEKFRNKEGAQNLFNKSGIIQKFFDILINQEEFNKIRNNQHGREIFRSLCNYCKLFKVNILDLFSANFEKLNHLLNQKIDNLHALNYIINDNLIYFFFFVRLENHTTIMKEQIQRFSTKKVYNDFIGNIRNAYITDKIIFVENIAKIVEISEYYQNKDYQNLIKGQLINSMVKFKQTTELKEKINFWIYLRIFINMNVNQILTEKERNEMQKQLLQLLVIYKQQEIQQFNEVFKQKMQEGKFEILDSDLFQDKQFPIINTSNIVELFNLLLSESESEKHISNLIFNFEPMQSDNQIEKLTQISLQICQSNLYLSQYTKSSRIQENSYLSLKFLNSIQKEHIFFNIFKQFYEISILVEEKTPQYFTILNIFQNAFVNIENFILNSKISLSKEKFFHDGVSYEDNQQNAYFQFLENKQILFKKFDIVQQMLNTKGFNIYTQKYFSFFSFDLKNIIETNFLTSEHVEKQKHLKKLQEQGEEVENEEQHNQQVEDCVILLTQMGFTRPQVLRACGQVRVLDIALLLEQLEKDQQEDIIKQSRLQMKPNIQQQNIQQTQEFNKINSQQLVENLFNIQKNIAFYQIEQITKNEIKSFLNNMISLISFEKENFVLVAFLEKILEYLFKKVDENYIYIQIVRELAVSFEFPSEILDKYIKALLEKEGEVDIQKDIYNLLTIMIKSNFCQFDFKETVVKMVQILQNTDNIKLFEKVLLFLIEIFKQNNIYIDTFLDSNGIQTILQKSKIEGELCFNIIQLFFTLFFNQVYQFQLKQEIIFKFYQLTYSQNQDIMTKSINLDKITKHFVQQNQICIFNQIVQDVFHFKKEDDQINCTLKQDPTTEIMYKINRYSSQTIDNLINFMLKQDFKGLMSFEIINQLLINILQKYSVLIPMVLQMQYNNINLNDIFFNQNKHKYYKLIQVIYSDIPILTLQKDLILPISVFLKRDILSKIYKQIQEDDCEGVIQLHCILMKLKDTVILSTGNFNFLKEYLNKLQKIKKDDVKNKEYVNLVEICTFLLKNRLSLLQGKYISIYFQKSENSFPCLKQFQIARKNIAQGFMNNFEINKDNFSKNWSSNIMKELKIGKFKPQQNQPEESQQQQQPQQAQQPQNQPQQQIEANHIPPLAPLVQPAQLNFFNHPPQQQDINLNSIHQYLNHIHQPESNSHQFSDNNIIQQIMQPGRDFHHQMHMLLDNNPEHMIQDQIQNLQNRLLGRLGFGDRDSEEEFGVQNMLDRREEPFQKSVQPVNLDLSEVEDFNMRQYVYDVDNSYDFKLCVQPPSSENQLRLKNLNRENLYLLDRYPNLQVQFCYNVMLTKILNRLVTEESEDSEEKRALNCEVQQEAVIYQQVKVDREIIKQNLWFVEEETQAESVLVVSRQKYNLEKISNGVLQELVKEINEKDLFQKEDKVEEKKEEKVEEKKEEKVEEKKEEKVEEKKMEEKVEEKKMEENVEEEKVEGKEEEKVEEKKEEKVEEKKDEKAEEKQEEKVEEIKVEGKNEEKVEEKNEEKVEEQKEEQNQQPQEEKPEESKVNNAPFPKSANFLSRMNLTIDFLTSHDIDPTFFEDLPEEYMMDTIQQYQPHNPNAQQDFLNELPEEFRQDVLQQQAALRGEAQEELSFHNNPAAFIESLQPEMREDILLSQGNEIIDRLPHYLRQEAQMLRERAQQQRYQEEQKMIESQQKTKLQQQKDKEVDLFEVYKDSASIQEEEQLISIYNELIQIDPEEFEHFPFDLLTLSLISDKFFNNIIAKSFAIISESDVNSKITSLYILQISSQFKINAFLAAPEPIPLIKLINLLSNTDLQSKIPLNSLIKIIFNILTKIENDKITFEQEQIQKIAQTLILDNLKSSSQEKIVEIINKLSKNIKNVAHFVQEIVKLLFQLSKEIVDKIDSVDESDVLKGSNFFKITKLIQNFYKLQKENENELSEGQKEIRNQFFTLLKSQEIIALFFKIVEFSQEKDKYNNDKLLQKHVKIFRSFYIIHQLLFAQDKQQQTQENYYTYSDYDEIQKTSNLTYEQVANMEFDHEVFFSFLSLKGKFLLNQILRQVLRENAEKKIMQSLFNHQPVFEVFKKHQFLVDFEIKQEIFKQETILMKRQSQKMHKKIRINRNEVFAESYVRFDQMTPMDLRDKFSIQFIGEEGIDAGGLIKEWFLILSKEIFKPHSPLFVPTENGNTFQPCTISNMVDNANNLYFKFVGRFVAKAMFDGQFLDAHFSRFFYKHIIGKQLSLKDMADIDQKYYLNLKNYVLERDPTDLMLTFSLESNELGVQKSVDLVPNGKDIAVTNENKLEYILALCKYKLGTELSNQINYFKKGFNDLIPQQLVSIFDSHELELVICGISEIDLVDLKKNTKYSQYSVNSIQIIWLWEVLEEFDNADRSSFVQFIYGTSKVSLNGFKDQKLQIQKTVQKELLPSAHTCFNILDLPTYDTKKELKTKLIIAIQEGKEGFGFA